MRINIILLSVIFFSSGIYSQNQDKIKDYDGIPIITYGYNIHNPHTFGNYNFSKMTDAGIFALEVVDIDNTMYSEILSNTSLNIIPDQAGNNVLNYINHYTYGRYSKWEAEGTPETEGAATLSHNIAHTTISDGSVITNSNNIPSGTILISGPKYAQEVTYSYEHESIIYDANFRLKLENIGSPHPQPTDVICTLRVYCAKWDVVNYTSWQIVDEYYYDKVLRYSEFTGGWDNKILSYNLEDAYNHFWSDPMPESMYRISKKNGDYVEYKFIEHVEFQVIWQADESKVKLYIDYVTVYDSRGKRLIIDDLATNEINSQVTELTNFKSKTAGWLSADEPYVIDNYAPIKKVNEIIDAIPNNDAHLWIAFPGHWSGTYGNPGNLGLYLNQVYQVDEFMKRVKKANIWMNCYMFDDPYDANYNPWPGGDYRVRNINRIGELLYKKCNEANQYEGVDLYWGASVQTGKYYIYQEQPPYIDTNYVEITSQQFLYTTNLALLYGAKLISPWLYFGFINDPAENDLWDYTGLANAQDQYQENYKYFTLKDTIAPRLKGLLGKTLRKLRPYVQYAGPNGINYYPPTAPENLINGYMYIEDVFPPEISQYNEYGIDFGFFYDPEDEYKKYFMLLNRYYSEEDIYQIHLKNLDTYTNWNLTNYVDTTSATLLAVNNKAQFLDTVYRGDANLYSIAPVATHGGNLIADETVGEGMTLYDDMTITNNATLTVNGTYIAKANITVKNGGKIVAGTDGKIVFDPGKGIIIDGNAEIKGASNNRLTLEFDNSTPVGVYIPPGRSLNISYCDVKKAQVGLKADPGSGIDIYYVSFYTLKSLILI